MLDSLPDNDPMATYRVSLEGGDAEAGEIVFRKGTTAACLRCHTVRGHGGIAGPDLSEVASRLTREQMLHSLIEPSAVIVEGYGEEASAMPSVVDVLTRREIRDVIEYLSTMR